MFNYTGDDAGFQTLLNEYRHFYNRVADPDIGARVLRVVMPNVTRRFINIISSAAIRVHLRTWLDDNLEALRSHLDEIQRLRVSIGLEEDEELKDLRELLVRPTNYCKLALKTLGYGFGMFSAATLAYQGFFKAPEIAVGIASSEATPAAITFGSSYVADVIKKIV